MVNYFQMKKKIVHSRYSQKLRRYNIRLFAERCLRDNKMGFYSESECPFSFESSQSVDDVVGEW